MSAIREMQFKTGGLALLGQGGTADEQGVIIGMASPFGPPADYEGDIILSGAYRESLKVRPWVPLLWQHKTDQVLGKTLLLNESPEGLVFKAQIMGTSLGLDARVLVRGGAISGISIGYNVKDYIPGDRKTGVRRKVTRIDLYEISLVTWPAADRARVSSYAAAPLRLALEDGLAIAEAEDLRRRGKKIPHRLQTRAIEAEIHQTNRWLFDDCFPMREIIDAINRDLIEIGLWETRAL